MLMRFDPFRDLDRLADQVSRGSRQLPAVLPMDAYRRGESFIVHFDLPGADPESIDLTVERNVLTVQAERSWPRHEGDEVVVSERPQGTFSRQLFLGETLDSDRVQASYENGVLTLTVPVAEAAKPRRVQISGAGNEKASAVDAQSTVA